jgi:Ca2+-binding EF-hand superfamily protein
MASPRGRGPTIDSKIREAFNLIDTDNSGTIDVAELTVRSPAPK